MQQHLSKSLRARIEKNIKSNIDSDKRVDEQEKERENKMKNKMKVNKNEAVDYREESMKWNKLRRENLGAYSQAGWARLARGYKCSYINAVARALTQSPFLSKVPDEGGYPIYAFTDKPVTKIFIEDVIKKERNKALKRRKADVSEKEIDKTPPAVKEVARNIVKMFELRLIGQVERVVSTISQEQLDTIRLVADTWKDEDLNIFYTINRCKYFVTPIERRE